MSSPAESNHVLRFTVSDRLEHAAQILTFVPLAITGLVQRYAGSGLSQGIIDLLGGIEAVRIIHRVFAAALMIAVVYHLGAIGYRRFVLQVPRSMGPGWSDLRAAGQALAYNLGRRDSRPRQGRYTFEEKIEYWSLVWGTVLMAATGFLLWNPIASAKLIPGSFIPAARAAHGGEAVLALLAILVWHSYHVHVRHFNKSMFTGYLSVEEMEADHALELSTAKTDGPPSPDDLRRRRNRYLPIYGSGALVLLIGIWLFVSFEDTAILTIEPIESPVVFAPISTTTIPWRTASTSTSTTVESSTTTIPGSGNIDFAWEDFASSFQAKCSMCHGENTQTSGLSLATFDDAVAGGERGPGVVPGDSDASTIVVIQEAGGHPGQLDDITLANLRTWIDAGAPEQTGGSTVTTTAGGTPTWEDLASVFAGSCGMCHGQDIQTSGLSLATFDDAVAGGDGGPGVVPGDPDASTIVIIQEAGGHPGQLDDTALAILRAWIDAGAPER